MAQNEMKAKAGLPERVRLNEGLARRNVLGSKTQALRTRSAKESPMLGVPRSRLRFASGHDAAFGVGSLRRSAASHRKASEAARGGNYRNEAVCSFIGIRCALLLHREGRSQPQAKTHEEGSGPTLQRVHCNHVLRQSSLPLTRVALCPRQRIAR